jgi:5-deoxy-glucuronate isomerase
MSGYHSPLLVSPDLTSDERICITPQSAGWEQFSFSVRCLKQGRHWQFATGENELALTVLGGVCSVRSNRGKWPRVGRRPDVFSGMPYTLYLPRRTEFTVEAASEVVEFACGWAATDQDHPAQLVTPDQVPIEIRGGGNATRQINGMIKPGFDCHRLVVVEVYTPSGNWSSYPPHRHDHHCLALDGSLLEADLEEIYYYKIDKPEGYAYQHVYNDDHSLDELILVQDGQLVLVPQGYHPVVSAHGFTTYYLNYLAGTAQSLASHDDPTYAWIKDTWREKDPRLPLVTHAMENY